MRSVFSFRASIDRVQPHHEHADFGACTCNCFRQCLSPAAACSLRKVFDVHGDGRINEFQFIRMPAWSVPMGVWCVCVCVYLFCVVCLFVCLFACLPACLPACLSVCLLSRETESNTYWVSPLFCTHTRVPGLLGFPVRLPSKSQSRLHQ